MADNFSPYSRGIIARIFYPLSRGVASNFKYGSIGYLADELVWILVGDGVNAGRLVGIRIGILRIIKTTVVYY
jgi:hypothetical protein